MKTKNIFIRDVPADQWARYKYLADLEGKKAAEKIREHIQKTANNKS